MNKRMKAISTLGCVSLLLAGTALAGEGVEVKLTNDGTQNIVVTVYDTSTTPERVVLANMRINGFTSVPISLPADATGQANLAWTAISADPVFPKCGHAATVASNESSVNVHADSSCRI